MIFIFPIFWGHFALLDSGRIPNPDPLTWSGSNPDPQQFQERSSHETTVPQVYVPS